MIKKRIMIIIVLIFLMTGCGGQEAEKPKEASKSYNKFGGGEVVLKVVSGSENRELEPIIEKYAKKNNLTIEMNYMGSIDIMRELQSGSNEFDAVWPASSIWISMGDKSFRVKHTESTTITPVVFGIKKSLAEKMGFVGKGVSIKDIMAKIKSGDLKFCMTSATQSNSGASAYLGFLSALSGSPEVLNEGHLENTNLQSEITSLLSGVDRSSGSSEWLKTLFLNGNYDAMVNYESLIITTNQELIEKGEEPLYVVYPYDGLSLADSPLGYIDNGDKKKEEAFLKFQEYLLSKVTQNELQKLGRRTGYKGVFEENKKYFNKDWGIDTERVLSPIKIPAGDVLMEALNLYQSEFRKPSLSIYCLDFSGSMSGEGEEQVREAMDLILNQQRAKGILLQANPKEVNEIIFFDSDVIGTIKTDKSTPEELQKLNDAVKNQEIGGGTNMYVAMTEALETLKGYNLNNYTPAIILLTDGESSGSFDDFKEKYDELNSDVPVFSIMFGSANPGQLDEIAQYTNARVFDGRENLVNAFRSVKGYN